MKKLLGLYAAVALSIALSAGQSTAAESERVGTILTSGPCLAAYTEALKELGSGVEPGSCRYMYTSDEHKGALAQLDIAFGISRETILIVAKTEDGKSWTATSFDESDRHIAVGR